MHLLRPPPYFRVWCRLLVAAALLPLTALFAFASTAADESYADPAGDDPAVYVAPGDVEAETQVREELVAPPNVERLDLGIDRAETSSSSQTAGWLQKCAEDGPDCPLVDSYVREFMPYEGTVNITAGHPGNLNVFNQGAVIAGGGTSVDDEWNDVVFAPFSVISGGAGAALFLASHSVIAGGRGNNIFATSEELSSSYSVISGGIANTIEDSQYSAISGGRGNIVEDAWNSVISGGAWNHLKPYADASVISGGADNYLGGQPYNAIGGGVENKIEDAAQSAIAGGYSNEIRNFSPDSLLNAFIGGGFNNVVRNLYIPSTTSGAAIVGGHSNRIEDAAQSVIAGGDSNRVQGSYDSLLNVFIGGGFNNLVNNKTTSPTISGAAIVSGHSNWIQEGWATTIIGGENNHIFDASSSACGGRMNSVRSNNAFAFGYMNKLWSGAHNSIALGYDNRVSAKHTVALGSGGRASWDHYGSFLFSDRSTEYSHWTQGPNTFNVRAEGGSYFSHSVSGSQLVTHSSRYPGDVGEAYDAVASVQGAGGTLSHEGLHPFVRHEYSDGSGGLDVSTLVVAQSKVIQDLIERVEDLEARLAQTESR